MKFVCYAQRCFIATIFLLFSSSIFAAEPIVAAAADLKFALEEVVFSIAIASITIAGCISGQTLAYKRALWTAASSSAAALQRHHSVISHRSASRRSPTALPSR